MKEKISIPSNPRYIKKIISRIVDILVERRINKSIIFDVRLSAEEALLNAIEHGNKRRKGLLVEASFSIDDKQLELVIKDKGSGFDKIALPDPTKDNNILRSHGRGVYLIHKLMDKVEYSRKGNAVKLIKYLKGGCSL